MHNVKVKIVNAKQTKLHNNFKNTKCKLLRTNAAISKQAERVVIALAQRTTPEDGQITATETCRVF
jgi:hypothetical protein